MEGRGGHISFNNKVGKGMISLPPEWNCVLKIVARRIAKKKKLNRKLPCCPPATPEGDCRMKKDLGGFAWTCLTRKSNSDTYRHLYIYIYPSSIALKPKPVALNLKS